MNLVLIEWLKLKGLRTFKVILILYAVLLPLFFYSLSGIPLFKYFYSDVIYAFPKVYHYVTYISSFFNLILGVIIILFTCNEIKYKTQRQNMIDGLSKREMILSKFYVILLMSIVVTLYAFLVAFCFGMSTSSTEYFEGVRYIGFYFISTFGYFIFAFFLANLLKNSSLTIVIYLLSSFIESIIGMGLVSKEFSQFLPLNTFSNLIPMPIIPDGFEYMMTEIQRASLGFGYGLCFVVIAYIILIRRDV